MTQEIIEMAIEIGLEYRKNNNEINTPYCDGVHIDELQLFAKLVEAKKRNDVLEEVAAEFDKMKVFGDTAASFAIFVREMKV